MDYFLHLLIIICFYTILSQSLNLSAGITGLISFSQAGFYGIGAYTTALLSANYNLPFGINLCIAMVVSGIIAFIISIIALRTVEDYFIICTLGIQIIIFSLMNNLTDLTKGPLGISNIPMIHLLGRNLDTKFTFLLLSLFFVIIVWFVLRNISTSGFGRMLKAISDDEIYAQSVGVNVYRSKIVSFTLCATLAAIPGVLYAHYITYIDPTSFTVNESIFILSIVIIGGMGSLRGSLFASFLLVAIPEILRFVGMPDGIAANLRQIVYGFILIIIMMKAKNFKGFISSLFTA